MDYDKNKYIMITFIPNYHLLNLVLHLSLRLVVIIGLVRLMRFNKPLRKKEINDEISLRNIIEE